MQPDLAADSSFSEFDVIFCRNAMSYLNLPLQRRLHHFFPENLVPSSIPASAATIR